MDAGFDYVGGERRGDRGHGARAERDLCDPFHRQRRARHSPTRSSYALARREGLPVASVSVLRGQLFADSRSAAPWIPSHAADSVTGSIDSTTGGGSTRGGRLAHRRHGRLHPGRARCGRRPGKDRGRDRSLSGSIGLSESTFATHGRIGSSASPAKFPWHPDRSNRCRWSFVAPGGRGPRTVRGAYGVDGTQVESNVGKRRGVRRTVRRRSISSSGARSSRVTTSERTAPPSARTGVALISVRTLRPSGRRARLLRRAPSRPCRATA